MNECSYGITGLRLSERKAIHIWPCIQNSSSAVNAPLFLIWRTWPTSREYRNPKDEARNDELDSISRSLFHYLTRTRKYIKIKYKKKRISRQWNFVIKLDSWIITSIKNSMLCLRFRDWEWNFILKCEQGFITTERYREILLSFVINALSLRYVQSIPDSRRPTFALIFSGELLWHRVMFRDFSFDCSGHCVIR